MEFFGNLSLIKPVGKNYVKCKARHKVTFHIHIFLFYIHFYFPYFISWKKDSISSEYLIPSQHSLVLHKKHLIQTSKMNE